MLLDPANWELQFEAALGKQGDDIKKICIPKGQGIAGWVAENNAATIIPEAQTDERFYRDADRATRFVTPLDDRRAAARQEARDRRDADHQQAGRHIRPHRPESGGRPGQSGGTGH